MHIFALFLFCILVQLKTQMAFWLKNNTKISLEKGFQMLIIVTVDDIYRAFHDWLHCKVTMDSYREP